MKTVMHRLLARQAKLVGSLDDARVSADRPQAVHQPVSREDRAALRAAEEHALEAVKEPLSRGALDEAAALLQPHVATAQSAETLTTLARVRSLQGAPDEALILLGRADAIDPSDIKVPHFLAELLEAYGRPRDALQYRRRVAFATAVGTADAFVRLIACIVKGAPVNGSPPLSEIRIALQRLQSASDLNDELRTRAASHLYAVPEMADKARDLLAAANPCPVGQVEIELKWRTLIRWSETQGLPLHQLSDAGRPGRRPLVAELTDACFVHGLPGVPIFDDARVAIGSLPLANLRSNHRDPLSPLLLSSPHRILVRAPDTMHTIEEPCIYVGGSLDHHENLLLHVGSLSTLDALPLETEHLPLLLHGDASPKLKELLALLGLSHRRLIVSPSSHMCRLQHTYFPSRLASPNGGVDPLVIDWCRRRLGVSAAARTSRRLFLRESHRDVRRLTNEDEVAAALRPHGFEAVELGGLSLREQVDLIASAAHMVAFESPSLSNLVFASPQARLTLLCGPHAVGDPAAPGRMATFASACGLQVRTVTCRRATAIRRASEFETDFEVDVHRLLDAVHP